MKKPVLVIMAAGMGSRYGGLKQIDPVDSHGHAILDFSIYDAIKTGFEEVIFIITHKIEEDFKKAIGNRISKQVNVKYAYQQLENLPKGFSVPKGRIKPWGTGHAVLSCMGIVDGPFAVINADDYYGRNAFESIFNYLSLAKDDEKYRYAMVGYLLKNTLTPNGHVARGICQIDENEMLTSICERTQIERRINATAYTEDDGQTWEPIPENSIVSMNLWGFTNSIITELQENFSDFLSHGLQKNPLTCEYFLPDVVNKLMLKEKASVRILKSSDKWYGVTYKEDKADVINAIKRLKLQGQYPELLWK